MRIALSSLWTVFAPAKTTPPAFPSEERVSRPQSGAGRGPAAGLGGSLAAGERSGAERGRSQEAVGQQARGFAHAWPSCASWPGRLGLRPRELGDRVCASRTIPHGITTAPAAEAQFSRPPPRGEASGCISTAHKVARNL